MTSLIDVIFLLLLFFMLSSTFTRFAEVELAAANAGGATGAEPPVFVSLAEDTLRLNGTQLSLADLPGALDPFRSGSEPLAVLISAGNDVTAQRLTDLLAVLRQVPRLTATVLGAA